MRFESTRNCGKKVDFKQALLNPMPDDGGLYVPCDCEDLRHWILYADQNTSFANIAGTLTSGLINKEFSPIICEVIATKAFTFEPKIRQLDGHLFLLELNHGPTGSYRDFGVSFLISALEAILLMSGEKSILLDATSGPLGACMANASRGKKLIKSVLLYPRGKVTGLRESDFVWNGGNIYPIEVDGTEADCRNMVRKIFAQKELISKYHLTVANTSNIGRLLPQAFFYTFAFTRIKKIIQGDIYYALSPDNYGNLVSGLYSWLLSLPVNGFILPSSPHLCLDPRGKAFMPDASIPLAERPAADPADPSNLERLENVFRANSLMLRSFVYPAQVSKEQTAKACQELFSKYNIYADESTSSAYAASLLRKDLTESEDGSVVLVVKDDPSLSKGFLQQTLGEYPQMEANVLSSITPTQTGRYPIQKDDIDYLISVLNSLNLRRLF